MGTRPRLHMKRGTNFDIKGSFLFLNNRPAPLYLDVHFSNTHTEMHCTKKSSFTKTQVLKKSKDRVATNVVSFVLCKYVCVFSSTVKRDDTIKACKLAEQHKTS